MVRNFASELAAARAAQDWDAAERIWEDRRLAEVDHDEAILDDLDDLDVTENGWIEHDGSGIPLPQGAMVQVRCRDAGYSPFNANPAGVWDFCEPSCWQDNGLRDDIIAYRVVQS